MNLNLFVMNLNLFQFALPLKTNDGLDYARALTVWEELALDEGGFTDLGVRRGSWRDERDGKVYREEMKWYQFAGDDAAANRLTKAALELFPDQKAFFIARVGTADNVMNVMVGATPEPVRALPPIYNRRGVASRRGDPALDGAFDIRSAI